MERIICAAIKYERTIVAGMRHSDCYVTLCELKGWDMKTATLPGRDFQGFLTTENRFVSRKEAYEIAKREDQLLFGILHDSDPILISEELY